MYNMLQYIDKVKTRSSRYDVQLELDDLTVEMLVNRARVDVQAATIPLFRQRFGRRVILGTTPTLVSNFNTGTVQYYTTTLPTDFIQDEVVLISTSDAAWEARKMDKREMYGVSRNSFNKPTVNSPVYCIEKDTASAVFSIIASKGSAVVGASEISIWYTAALPYLQAYPVSGIADAERKMSYQWVELVVLCALTKCYEMTQYGQLRDLISADIDTMVSLMEEAYKTNIDRSKLLLPSRVSLIPNIPIMENMQGLQNGN